jgi:PDZ domain
MEKTMRVMISVLTGAAVLGMAPALGAQQKTPAPRRQPAPSTRIAPEREKCSTDDGRTECFIFRRGDMDSVMMKRPAIGVQLSPTGTARDTIGVFVSRVTPKGPAENAGIVEGDRIVSINGVDLRVNAADAGDSYAAGLPSRRLTREVAKLSPGNVATLRVASGGRIRDVQVTVGRASDLREAGAFGLMMDGGPNDMFRAMPDMENMRTRLRELPRMRIEQFDGRRMDLDGLRDRLEIERLAPLRDGAPFRVLRENGDVIVGPEGRAMIEKRSKEKAEEKARAEKKK